MRKFMLLLAVVLADLLGFGCENPVNVAPVQEKTMYALKDGAALQDWSGAAVKTFRYGEAVRVQRCEGSQCSTKISGKLATIALSELSEEPPPMGARYVWGHFGSLKPNQKVTLRAYNPSTRALQVDGGTWVNESALGERPETATEAKTREKAEAAAKIEEARQRKEEARQQRESQKLAAIAFEKERRSFARQLRDNYLAQGADIKVSVSGAHAHRLSLEYPLINDVWLYQFQHNSDVIDALRSKGFTEIDLSNGWDYAKRLTF